MRKVVNVVVGIACMLIILLMYTNTGIAKIKEADDPVNETDQEETTADSNETSATDSTEQEKQDPQQLEIALNDSISLKIIVEDSKELGQTLLDKRPDYILRFPVSSSASLYSGNENVEAAAILGLQAEFPYEVKSTVLFSVGSMNDVSLDSTGGLGNFMMNPGISNYAGQVNFEISTAYLDVLWRTTIKPFVSTSERIDPTEVDEKEREARKRILTSNWDTRLYLEGGYGSAKVSDLGFTFENEAGQLDSLNSEILGVIYGSIGMRIYFFTDWSLDEPHEMGMGFGYTTRILSGEMGRNSELLKHVMGSDETHYSGYEFSLFGRIGNFHPYVKVTNISGGDINSFSDWQGIVGVDLMAELFNKTGKKPTKKPTEKSQSQNGTE